MSQLCRAFRRPGCCKTVHMQLLYQNIPHSLIRISDFEFFYTAVAWAWITFGTIILLCLRHKYLKSYNKLEKNASVLECHKKVSTKRTAIRRAGYFGKILWQIMAFHQTSLLKNLRNSIPNIPFQNITKNKTNKTSVNKRPHPTKWKKKS